MNKRKLILGSVVVAGITVILLESPLCKKSIAKEMIVDADNIKDITINTTSANVEVIPSNSDQIIVTFEGKINKLYGVEDNFHIEQQQTTLHINYPVSKRNSILNRDDMTLQVAIPHEHLPSFEVSATSGDIRIDNMQTQQVAIHSQSGDQTVTNTRAEKQITMNATSGDIKIENLQANSATFTANSGDISVKNEQLKTNMDFTTSTGDVTLTFNQAPESMQVDFAGKSGRPHSKIDDLTFKNVGENDAVGIIGTGKYKINVQTKSGDLTLA